MNDRAPTYKELGVATILSGGQQFFLERRRIIKDAVLYVFCMYS